MSLDDLNREQKRQLKKMGALDEQGRPQRDRRQPQTRKKNERVGIRQYLKEVRDEMRKELQFVNEELDATSADLETMIERNNSGILLKVADNAMCKLVFSAAPKISARGVKAVIRLGMLGSIAALIGQTVRQLKTKVVDKATSQTPRASFRFAFRG